MITGKIKNKLDKLWNAMWSNPMTNPSLINRLFRACILCVKWAIMGHIKRGLSQISTWVLKGLARIRQTTPLLNGSV